MPRRSSEARRRWSERWTVIGAEYTGVPSGVSIFRAGDLEPVEHAVERAEIDLAVAVLAEAGDLLHLVLEEEPVAGHRLAVPAEPPHVPGDEIAVEIDAFERRL